MKQAFKPNCLKGHILFAQKKYYSSSTLYRDLIESYPGESKTNHVLLNLAMSYEENGNLQKSVDTLQELLPSYHSPQFIGAKITHLKRRMGLLPGAKGKLRR